MNLKPYGMEPTHKTEPAFNALHNLEDIASIYAGRLVETAQCLLSEGALSLVFADSDVVGVGRVGYMLLRG